MKNYTTLLYGIAYSLFTSATTVAEQNVLYIGAVSTDIPAAMHQRLSPLTHYLSSTLKQPVRLMLSPNMSTAVQQTIDGRIDIAYLTPMAYLEAKRSANVQLMVKSIITGKSTCQLMIVVKDESPIATIDELRGKSFAFGDRASFIQHAIVADSGITLNQFKNYQFLGHYDNVARAVMNSDFDAGILRDTIAKRWQEKGLRILYRSQELPAYNFTARENIEPELFLQIQQALLALDKSNPQHRHILNAIDPEHEGFVAALDQEYNNARLLVEPYLEPALKAGSNLGQ